MKLILASSSPRRSEIMKSAGYEFEIVPSNAEENTYENRPGELVKRLSHRKASAVAQGNPGAVVIGADTVVSLDGAILTKPKDPKDAARMLRLLSGKTHEVFSGVSIIGCGADESFFVCSSVTFRKLGEKLIRQYVSTGEPLDKAGAYGIQGRGALLVEKIDGDYFNIMGLPVSALAQRLGALFGIWPF